MLRSTASIALSSLVAVCLLACATTTAQDQEQSFSTDRLASLRGQLRLRAAAAARWTGLQQELARGVRPQNTGYVGKAVLLRGTVLRWVNPVPLQIRESDLRCSVTLTPAEAADILKRPADTAVLEVLGEIYSITDTGHISLTSITSRVVAAD